MKKPALRHKAKRSLKHCAAFLLCCALTVAFYAPPALGADEPEPESAAPQLLETEAPAFAEDPEDEPSAETPVAPPRFYSITFSMGSFGSKTVQVGAGQYPEVPAIPELPSATVLGWFNAAGQQVDPVSLPAEQDAVYTARWSRQVGSLLNTQEHFAYIKGYTNGMFRPKAGITRAEAAQLFYNLLLTQSWEEKSFSDVGSDKWYAKPVGVMATLGILQGYTDGTFCPNKKITRAEFVKMAVSFDSITTGENPFTDVSNTSWAAPYIVTASSKGWISGFKDGTFHPSDTITREQAVVILNKMLGRVPEQSVEEKQDVKNFYDVFPSVWSYGDIVEASTTHTYSSSGSGETWLYYEPDNSTVEESGWVTDGTDRYYLDAGTRKFLRGTQTVEGVKYIFDSSTGVAFNGFRNEGSWRWYYKNGLKQTDISNLGVTTGPYFIKVYKPSNYLIIFAKDTNTGHYTIPVKAMRVSCGYGTPCGTFYTPSRYRWLKMEGNTFAQWCTQIQGNYLFHSVPNWTHNNFDLEVEEYNHLGDTRSMGCVRLNCQNAKWIFDNCALGTQVFISAVEKSGPLPKPDGIQIPAWHTWDPTDPTAYWKCRQKGCH